MVYCLDQGSFECARSEGVKTVKVFPKEPLADEANYGTKEFNRIMIEKIRMINKELEKETPLLYLDTDIVVTKNPIPYLRSLPSKDAYFQSDELDFRKSDVTNHCAGCIYISPTSSSKTLFKKTLTYLQQNPTLLDQTILNQLINDNQESFKIGTMDPTLFPNGPRYFNNTISNYPYLIHNNYIVGLQEKIKRFKKHKLWFLDNERCILLTQYYEPKWEERKEEMEECLQKNLNHSDIERVVLFTEKKLSSVLF